MFDRTKAIEVAWQTILDRANGLDRYQLAVAVVDAVLALDKPTDGEGDDVYARFIEELDAITITPYQAAAHIVGHLTRAVKRAQMVVDGELPPVAERIDP